MARVFRPGQSTRLWWMVHSCSCLALPLFRFLGSPSYLFRLSHRYPGMKSRLGGWTGWSDGRGGGAARGGVILMGVLSIRVIADRTAGQQSEALAERLASTASPRKCTLASASACRGFDPGLLVEALCIHGITQSACPQDKEQTRTYR